MGFNFEFIFCAIWYFFIKSLCKFGKLYILSIAKMEFDFILLKAVRQYLYEGYIHVFSIYFGPAH